MRISLGSVIVVLFVILHHHLAYTQQFSDSIPPNTSIVAPAAGEIVKGRISVDTKACDNVGVTKVEILVDGIVVGSDTTFPYSVPWSSNSVANGNHSLKSKAYDGGSNVATSPEINITTNNEFVHPAISITAPANGSLLQGNITTNATATDNVAVARVEFYVDGMLVGTDTSSPYSVTWNSSIVPDGQHNLVGKAFDTSENLGVSSSVNFRVDNGTPVATIAFPIDGSFVKQVTTVVATATDEIGVTKVEFYLDNNLIGSDTTSPYSFNWNTTSVPDGPHNLSCRAYDQIGHVGISQNVMVKVDNTLPITSVTAPAPGSTVTFSTQLTAMASDNIGVTSVEFYVDSTRIGSDTTSPYGLSWNSLSVPNRNHILISKALDGAGNIGSSVGINITVNNPPVLFVDDFEDGDAQNWTFSGGTWTVSNGSLQGNGTSQKAIAPFSGCSSCTVEGDLQAAGGATSNVSLVGWYVDSKNYVELILKVNANSWDLIQKSAGKNAAKKSFTQSLSSNTNYRARIAFDGTSLRVYINGTLIITMQPVGLLNGKVGFGVDNTSGTFREILVF